MIMNEKHVNANVYNSSKTLATLALLIVAFNEQRFQLPGSELNRSLLVIFLIEEQGEKEALNSVKRLFHRLSLKLML